MQKYGKMANYFAPTYVNVIYWEKKQLLNFQDRSAIISSPPSSSERSVEGEGGDEMR